MRNEVMQVKKRFSIQRFLSNEGSSGVILIIAAALGIIMANSPLKTIYTTVLGAGFKIDTQYFYLALTTTKFINYVLMSIFFFVVGMEIKREMTTGHLSSIKKAVAPFAAALGGMIIPALIFLAIADEKYRHGWAIPMATDIALAVGVLSLLGNRVSLGMKTFLLALAVVDDLGAITIIALFYSKGVSVGWLVAGLILTGAFYFLTRTQSTPRIVVALIVFLIWYSFYRSGVHATVAGVLMGLTLAHNDELEERLHPWTSYVIIPIFAFANAGVTISASALGNALTSSLGIAVMAGLILGKPLGIIAFSKIATGLRLAQMPSYQGKFALVGAGSAAGIGFTVAIFIAQLSFEDQARQELAIIAVIIASVVSGLLSVALNRLSPTQHEMREESL